MQPDQPYGPPPPPMPEQPQPQPQSPPPPSQGPQPNYDFLYQQPQKTRRLPLFGNSLAGKIAVVLICLLLVVIVLAIIKSIIIPPPFSKSAYQIVVDRQQEMLHILSVDITSQNVGQLSAQNQNLAATAKATLVTAQNKTLGFMSAYKVKINPQQLAGVYSKTIDQDFTSGLTASNFDSVFVSQMKFQLNSYKNELKTAYASTNVNSGKGILNTEFKEANLLLSGLGT